MTVTLTTRHIATLLCLLSVLGGAVLLWNEGALPSVLPNQQITQATYVYEKDQGGVPPSVAFVLREVNQAGKIAAAVIEEDIVDDSGSTPPQYKIAVEAARKAGLPALIVQAGESVVETVEAPTTEEQVREAIR